MIWKDIVGYEGYQVSDTGLVRTHNKTSYTEHHGVRHWKDRVLKQKVSNPRRGDYTVDLWKCGKPKRILVARIVACTFLNESLDTSMSVNHIDGNPRNNNISNLEIVSISDNIRHAFKNGLNKKNCKPILLTNKATGETKYFYGRTDACRYMGRSDMYIIRKEKRGLHEDDLYSWQDVI